MPRPTTGSPANATTLLSAHGEPVVLQDGSEIEAIVSQRRELVYSGSEAREIVHTAINVPVVFKGSLDQGQDVTVRGVRYYVPTLVNSGDGWLIGTLSAGV